MDTQPVATSEEAGLALTGSDEPPGSDPSPARTGQNLTVALLPLAIIGLLVVSFIAAAWTFLAALAPA